MSCLHLLEHAFSSRVHAYMQPTVMSEQWSNNHMYLLRGFSILLSRIWKVFFQLNYSGLHLCTLCYTENKTSAVILSTCKSYYNLRGQSLKGKGREAKSRARPLEEKRKLFLTASLPCSIAHPIHSRACPSFLQTLYYAGQSFHFSR